MSDAKMFLVGMVFGIYATSMAVVIWGATEDRDGTEPTASECSDSARVDTPNCNPRIPPYGSTVHQLDSATPEVGQIPTIGLEGFLLWVDGPKDMTPCYHADGRPADRLCLPKEKQ